MNIAAFEATNVGPSEEIIVGIKVGTDNSSLIKAASSIASIFNMHLKMVSVLENNFRSKMAKVAHEHLDQDIGKARVEIEKLKRFCPKNTQPEPVVLRAEDPAEVLMSKDFFPSATYLVVGCSSRFYRWTPKELSVVLALTKQSQIPLLVVHDDAHMSDWSEPLKILIADDLSAEFEPLLRKAALFIRKFPNVSLYHLNVAQWDVYGYVTPLTKLDDEKPLTNKQCRERWAKKCTEREEQLKKRWSNIQKELGNVTNELKYKAIVITDQPVEGILDAELNFDIDVIIVGRGTRSPNGGKIYNRISMKKLLDKSRSLLVLPH